ncbi:MAG: ABC transporter permease [Promicromonosporaceae bacterium]|nr:ABC transporter permease [Promicromonosporaceae bacterium]
MTSATISLTAPGRAATFAQVGLMMQWQFRRAAQMVSFAFIMQIIMAVATVFGFGLLIGTPPPEAAMHLATGAATISLIMLGLVLAPQLTAQSRTEGSFDWMRTLPVSRIIFMVADLTLWTLIALPGAIVGIMLGSWHFDVTLSISPWIVLAIPLVALIASTVGFSMALVLKPMTAQLMTQFIVFIVLLFSPISFPAAHMPQWLIDIHQWLPVTPMAELMRATLISNHFDMPARSIIVLAVWTVLAVFGATRALQKRS